MGVWGFDSKEFTRTRLSSSQPLPDSGEVPERERCFHTPLGAGVYVDDPQEVGTRLCVAFDQVKERLKIDSPRPFAPATVLRSWCQDDLGESVRVAEAVVRDVLPEVRKLHFSFVALSSKQMQTVPVGGLACPVRPVPTAKFLESLNPMFSYITAWSYTAFSGGLPGEVRLDAFSSKQTPAWQNLLRHTNPSYWFRGDEVDPVICLADLVAFATDRVLYRRHEKLVPESIERLWGGPGAPEVSSWLVGKGNVEKVAWVSEDMIGPMKHVRHPIIFLLRDLPEAYKQHPEGKTLSSFIQGGTPFESAVRIAWRRGACLKFFQEFDDPPYIQRGDVFIHAGPKSREVVQTFADMYEVESYTFLEAGKLARDSM